MKRKKTSALAPDAGSLIGDWTRVDVADSGVADAADAALDAGLPLATSADVDDLDVCLASDEDLLDVLLVLADADVEWSRDMSLDAEDESSVGVRGRSARTQVRGGRWQWSDVDADADARGRTGGRRESPDADEGNREISKSSDD